jgi:hypothetical protein
MSRSETEARLYLRFPVVAAAAACLNAALCGPAFAAQAGVGFAGHVPPRIAHTAPGKPETVRLAVFTDRAILPVEGKASAYRVVAADGAIPEPGRAIRLPGGGEALIVELGALRERRIDLCNPGEGSCLTVEIVRLD